MRVTVTFPLPEGKREKKIFDFACSIPLTRIKNLDPEEVKNCPAKTIDQLFMYALRLPSKEFEGPTIQTFYNNLLKNCSVNANKLCLKIDTKIKPKAVIRKTLQPYLKKKSKKQTKPITIKKHSSRTVNWIRA
jgi:hypothetical protein